MNAGGIDVSKGKSMVAIMRPVGESVSTPFEIKHTTSDIKSLVERSNSIEGESRIVMEHTGRYYEVLAHQLSEANLFVSAINPKLIKDFDNDSLRKVKSFYAVLRFFKYIGQYMIQILIYCFVCVDFPFR